MKFPYIKYPGDVKSLLQGNDFEVVLDKEPWPPVKKNISLVDSKVSTGFLLLVWILYYTDFIGLIIAIPLLVLGILFLGLSLKQIASVVFKNKNAKKEYKRRLEELEEKKRLYIRRKEKITTKGKGDFLRKLQMIKVLSTFEVPQPITKSSPDLLETFFFFFLQHFFGQLITVDLAFTDGPYGTEYYSPNFIYWDPKLCLAINILSLNKAPYPESNNGIIEGDNHATLRKSCVLYFTPYQVLNQPVECCYYIAEIIYKLTGGNSIFKKFDSLKLNKINPVSNPDLEIPNLNLYEELKKYNFLNVEEGDMVLTRNHMQDSVMLTLRNFSPLPPDEIYCPKEVFPDLNPFSGIRMNLNNFVLGLPTKHYIGLPIEVNSKFDHSSKEFFREIPNVIRSKD